MPRPRGRPFKGLQPRMLALEKAHQCQKELRIARQQAKLRQEHNDFKTEPEPEEDGPIPMSVVETEIKVGPPQSFNNQTGNEDGVINEHVCYNVNRKTTTTSKSSANNNNKTTAATPPQKISMEGPPWIRPPFQSPSFCFVCVKPLTGQRKPKKVTEPECLRLLTQMLELSRPQSRQCLHQIGEPWKWIGLCQECRDWIKLVGERKELIAKLEKEIGIYKQQLVRKMKATKLDVTLSPMARDLGGPSSSNEKEVIQVVQRILNFVQKKNVDQLLPGASFFVERIYNADHQGEELGEAEEEEDPIFMNGEDQELPTTDPLALDNDETEECFQPPPPTTTFTPQQRLYYCGLCADNLTYKSEEELQRHTNQVHHRPTTTSSKIVRRKKRQRKQNFLVEDSVEYEELEEDDSVKKAKANHSMETASSLVFLHKPKIQTEPEEVIKSEGKHEIVKVSHPDSDPDCKAKGESSEEEDEAAEHLDDTMEAVPETDENDSSDPENEAEETIDMPKGPKTKVKPGKYDCPNCPDVKGYSVSRFAQHLAIHQRRPFQCTICSALFPPDEAQVEDHWEQKHSDAEADQIRPPDKFRKIAADPGDMWKCTGGCGSGFRTEDGRAAHALLCTQDLQTDSIVMPYWCKICDDDKPFRNIEEWRLHRVLRHPEVDRMSCPMCELSFAEKTVEGVEARQDLKMLSHIRHDHPWKPDKVHKIHLRREAHIHPECEECGVVFTSILHASAHFPSVHGISNQGLFVPCPVPCCGMRFSKFFGMRQHLHYIHFSADLLAVCDLCGMSFKRKESLAEHKLQTHGTLPEDMQIRSCPVEGCGYRAVKLGALVKHSQVAHGAAKKHVCKTCGKAFADSGKLRAHQHIHQNKESRPYQCEICGNSFAVRNYLYIHMRLSHEGRTFPSTNRKRGPKPSKSISRNKKMSVQE